MGRYKAITPERASAVFAAVTDREHIEIRHPQTAMTAVFRAIAGKLPARISFLIF